MNEPSISFHLPVTALPLHHTLQSIKDENISPIPEEYLLAVLLVLWTLTTGTPGPVLRREEKTEEL